MDIIENPDVIDVTDIKKRITDLIAQKAEEGVVLDLEKDKKKIAKLLEIPVDTLRQIFISERQERLLKKAELTSEELLDLDLSDKDLEHKYGKARIALLKIKQQEAEFIRETIGKDQGYSKRNELTGKNGEDFVVKAIVFSPPVLPKANESQN